MSNRTYLSIGDVLSLLRREFPDITISKIRFLESQGLVNPQRSPSGYRKFYDQDVGRLRWVLRQQREHFLPLRVIRDRLEGEGDLVAVERSSPTPAGGAGPAGAAAGQRDVAAGQRDVAAGQREEVAARSREAKVAVSVPDALASVRSLPPREAREASQAGAAPWDETDDGEEDWAAQGWHEAGRNGDPAGPAAPAAAAARRAEGSLGTLGVVSRQQSCLGQTSHPADAERVSTVASVPAASQAGDDLWGRAPGGGPPPGRGGRGEAQAGRRTETASVPQSPSAAEAAGAREARPPSGLGAGSGTPGSVTPQRGGAPVAAGATGANLTQEELCSGSGLAAETVHALERFGLIESLVVAGIPYYDEGALTVAKLAAELASYGVEPRHLRLYRNAVDREMGLVEQIITPLLRQRNPEARQRAMETTRELARIGEGMRAALLAREFTRQFGG